MSKNKLHVKKGDQVIIRSGANRGKTGTVIKVFPGEERILVEGEASVFHTKHVRPDPQRNIEGRSKLRPIHVSNVALIDPSTNKATRVRRERGEDGKVVRVSKASGHKFTA